LKKLELEIERERRAQEIEREREARAHEVAERDKQRAHELELRLELGIVPYASSSAAAVADNRAPFFGSMLRLSSCQNLMRMMSSLYC
jgi:hypothetical protein